MLLPKVTIVPALLVLANHDSADAAVAPHRIAYGSLIDNSSPVLLGGLTQDGVISITDIPTFKETKRALMSHLHACIMSIEDVPTQRFDDGTVRRSFATSTLPDGAGPQPIKTLEDFEALSANSKSASCTNFKSHLSSFRATVDQATRQFADRLSSEMGASLPKPLLSTSNSAGHDYEDIKQVVDGGVHLEHFHSYQKLGGGHEETTIEFHADQGFFIAFTPGMIVAALSHDHEAFTMAKQSAVLSSGFYIQDSRGEKHLMEFSGEDDLVFMMGDGVNQFINNRITDDHKELRVTPHALILSSQEGDSTARVWYGRMVLAPNDAYLPSMGSTFGETRQSLVDSKGVDIPLGIGCSSPHTKTVINTSRNLDGPETVSMCPEDELFCWFRCQKLADHGLTSTSCEDQSTTERKLEMQCINPRGQVVPDGKKHGDYYPLCTTNTNDTHPVTPLPEIDQQDDAVCTAEKWETFMKGTEDYDHKVELTQVDGSESMLLWSIVEDESGTKKIKARLAFDDVFGWLAMGFANQMDTVHNGMNGGSVIIAIPGGNYSAATGLDLGVPASIGTHKIHPTDTAFRHWMDPVETDETKTTVADFEDTGCFTAITFESDHINGQKFNFDGTDEMIWAGNSYDHFMGYHQRKNRARFTLDWNTGDIKFFGDGAEEVEEEVKSRGLIKSGILGMFTASVSMMYYIAN